MLCMRDMEWGYLAFTSQTHFRSWEFLPAWMDPFPSGRRWGPTAVTNTRWHQSPVPQAGPDPRLPCLVSHLLRELGSSTWTSSELPSHQALLWWSSGMRMWGLGRGTEERGCLLKAKYSSYWEIQTWGGKNHKDSRYCWCCRGCLPLKLFQFYIQFELVWAWGFLFLCVSQICPGDPRVCQAPFNKPSSTQVLFKASHLLQWTG